MIVATVSDNSRLSAITYYLKVEALDWSASENVKSLGWNEWLIWQHIMVASKCPDTFEGWIGLAFGQRMVSPIRNTKYAFAALTVLKARSSVVEQKA